MQVRGDGLVRQLEPHLVVALAGAAVRQCVATGFQRHFGLPFGEQRPRNRSAEQIFVLVHRAGAHQLPQVLRDELLAHVFHIHFGSAGLEGLLFQPIQLFAALPYVAANGHYLAAVMLFEPRNDDGCIQAAGVSQRYFFCFYFVHFFALLEQHQQDRFLHVQAVLGLVEGYALCRFHNFVRYFQAAFGGQAMHE